MKKNLSRIACLCLLAGATTLHAADGTWISDADGNWSDSGNWDSGVVANGIGSTASFINTITASRTVTSDVARTTGNLVFAGNAALNWTLTNSASFVLNNASGLATITVSSNTATINGSLGGISGNNTILKNGPGTLALAWNHTYTGGTIIGAGTVALNTAAAGQMGTGSVTLTNGAILSLYRANTTDDGSTIGSFTNTLTVPAGQAGTVWCSPRSVTGSAGSGSTFISPVTGAGTLTLRVNGTTRGGNAANFSAFTGTINVTGRTTADNFPVSFGGTAAPGFPGAKLHLAAGVYMYQWLNPPSSGSATTVQPIGELSGEVGSSLSGNPVNGRFVNWTIGYLNTASTFAGTVRNDAGAAMLTKVGTGTLILSGTNTYTGATLVSTGALYVVTGGSISNSASITVASNATFGVQIASANGQWVGTNLIFNAGSNFLTFNYGALATSAATAPLLILNNCTLNGTVYVSVNGGAGWAPGVYPLARYTGTLGGSGSFALGSTLPLRVTAIVSNDVPSKSLYLVVTGVSAPLKWAAASGVWDVATTANWKDATGVLTTYQEQNSVGDQVVLEDTQSGASPTITLSTLVAPGSVTVSNNTKSYVISGAGGITGGSTLTKQGSGALTLSTANSFTGGINLNAGSTTFSALTNLGGGAISFGGGTLQYNGNSDDISVRTVTFNAGGGTINDGGNALTFANPVGNSGAGGLTKAGAGTLTLTGTNKYFGNTVVADGTLALAANTYISNSAAIIVNSGKVLDAASSGVNLALANSQILAGAGTVNGAVTTAPGTTISPATNGVFGTLTLGGDVTFNGGTYACDVSTTAHDLLVVNGNLTLNSGTILTISAGTLTNGVYKIIQYSGGLGSGSGSAANLVINGFSQAGKVASLTDANSGEIDLVISSQGGAVKVWQGDGGNNFWDVETTTDWTNLTGVASMFVQGDKTIFDDTSANTTVNLQAAVQPGSVTVKGTQSYDFTTSGTGRISGTGSLTNNGTGILIIETPNNNSGQTVINAGTLQVGNGNGGDIGSGNVINNSALVFSQGDGNLHTVEQISGPGTVTLQGSATVAFDQNNTFTGGTLINNGTLQVGTGVGTSGTLGTGSVANNSLLVINRSGNYALNNGVSGSGTVSFAGSGTVTLTGLNTYQNNTYITNGIVKLGASEEIPDANNVPGSSGWLILDGGATAGTFDLNGFNETINALSGLAGTVNGLITNSGTSTTSTNVLTILENAGTTYNGFIAENAAGAKVQVVLRGTSELRLNANNTYSGGTLVGETATIGVGPGGVIGTGSITLSNGATMNLHNAGSSSVFVGNVVNIPDNSMGSFNSSQAGNGYSGLVFGGPTATNQIIGPVSISAASSLQYSNLSGTVLVASGYGLRFSATSLNNGGGNTTFDVEGTLSTRNGGTVTLGALEGAGTLGAPSTSGTATYLIGSKNLDTVFSGPINNGLPGTNIALTKMGAGRLTLSGTLSYQGNTIVSNGVLALQTSLDYSPSISLPSATAQLDISSQGLTLGNAIDQTLSGIGTVQGNLTVSSSYGCALTPGTAGTAGTLTVNGSVTLNNNTTNVMDFSAVSTTPGGGTNDLLKVNGDLALSGTVYVSPNFIGSGVVSFGAPYTVVRYTGSLSGDANNLALDTANYAHLAATFDTTTPGVITVTFTGSSNLVWRGDSTNSWQVGVVTNWFDGSSSNYFAQLDAVSFDNSASNFNAALVGTVSPTSITVNSASNYVFTGSGLIGGGGSLTKSGPGTLVISNTAANTFNGATVVSSGVIQAGGAGALSANSSLQIAAPGAVELAGYAASIGGLSGAGRLDNAATNTSVLTVGSGGSGLWSGNITNTASTNGISLTLNDTNNLVISGVNQLNSGTASTVNNGGATLIITNSGVITLSGAEFWIGANAAVTGKVVVAGGTLVVSNNYLVVGRNNTNANGTLIINSGTVQKAGANSVVVGSLGATGNLTVNGGQLLNNGALIVGENATATAVVNLNGGLLQAAQIRTNNVAASSVINFNGGTLQATAASTNFIQGTTANVQNGGLTLDDGGFVISLVTQPLVANGTGGVVKQGSGTVYLDAANTYTGPTTVNAGTLAGTGSVISPVVVAATGNLGAGDAGAVGKLTINNSLTLHGAAIFRISKTGGLKTNDQVAGVSTLNYGGTLVISNVTTDATALAPGDAFTLFSATTHVGSFASIGGAPAGLGYTFTNGVLSVITTIATNPTNITASVSGNHLSLSWPADHLGWTLQMQTNGLLAGLGTNWVSLPGSTTINSTNINIDPTLPTVFFRLKL